MTSNTQTPDGGFGAEPSEIVRDAGPPQPVRESGLLDVAFKQEIAESGRATGRLTSFLQARTVGCALKEWFGTARPQRQSAIESLNRAVGQIDELVSDQVNEVLHHPRFQKLEASWRGLEYLVQTRTDLVAEGDWARPPKIAVRVMNMSLTDVKRDLDRASEFDQSNIFQQVYTEEFGTPGGTPYGVVIADYEFQAWPDEDFPFDGVGILASLAGIGAAAFCPFITSVGPRFFELDSYDELERVNLEQVFDSRRNPRYIKWRALRESEDSRFLGLTMPRVLMRRPWNDSQDTEAGFVFRERVADIDRSKYLWGNSAYSFGEVVMRAYAQSGWLADIRGVERGVEGGGLVTGLPTESFSTDRRGIATKASTEVVITDVQERALGNAGFLSLCHCYDTEYSAFFSNQSAQEPREYQEFSATLNSKMSSMLQYVLCVSQFARYVKVIARDKVGTFADSSECEAFLHDWVTDYVTPDDSASADVRARRPLRDASISVRPRAGQPGVFDCEMLFQPHYELDDMSAAIRVQTQLGSSSE
jgi:type VI secretion system ImpC/EvpB family protein